MSQLGRISGPLLEANLIRLGVDLTFRNQRADTDLLYLDVNNSRIGVKTLGTNTVDVNNTIHTTNLIATTSAEVYNIKASTNVFSTWVGPINITPAQSNPLVLMDHMQAGTLDFKDNRVTALTVNSSIRLDPNGTGTTEILSSSTVNGNLSVTGNFNINGNLSKQGDIIVGDSILDTVTVVPDFTQDVNPGITLTYDLGKPTKRWRNVHVHSNGDIGSLTYNSFTISDQLQVDGPSATIHTLQSNDSVLLNSDTGIKDIERIRFSNQISTFTITGFTGANGVFIWDHGPSSPAGRRWAIGDCWLNATPFTNAINNGSITVGSRIIVKWSGSTYGVPFESVEVDMGIVLAIGDFFGTEHAQVWVSNPSNYERPFQINGDWETWMPLAYQADYVRVELPSSDSGNIITNLDATALTINSTGIGYVRFMDSNAVAIPAGTTGEQPTNAQLGQTRWNTTEGYLECFDGTVWNIATGPGNATVSVTEMEDLSNVWILVLG